ncbi:hypothetical protein GCM10010123_19260 [Pilimelia anulata]|uniref:Uncharacterized protein n=1 Tax=Pilimelia anulata TaxID=53371 RepID=A0A8J3F7L0_9ACTN|nr:hypothetical protein GCM10010123_19260 [Pilimelia anulata]
MCVLPMCSDVEVRGRTGKDPAGLTRIPALIIRLVAERRPFPSRTRDEVDEEVLEPMPAPYDP